MDITSPFERALLAEREGRSHEALQLFRTCLRNSEYDEGEILFHCDWCAEQESPEDYDQALKYYERTPSPHRGEDDD